MFHLLSAVSCLRWHALSNCSFHDFPQPPLLSSVRCSHHLLLWIMATVPKQLATPEDTFTALALQFNFEQRIKDKIIELGIRTIAEFRHYARSEDEIKKLFIDTIKDPAYEEMQGRLQAARLRFAWTACKALLDSEHAAASLPPAPTEEETLLPKQELEQLKEAFFRRYHLRPEPRQYPSDRLLSKLSRQLTRSQFEVMDLWTVRSLHQGGRGRVRLQSDAYQWTPTRPKMNGSHERRECPKIGLAPPPTEERPSFQAALGHPEGECWYDPQTRPDCNTTPQRCAPRGQFFLVRHWLRW